MSRWKQWLTLSCTAWLLLTASSRVSAQQALVLSGGGARGLAHVGVLLRLDELGYDPDLVVGNSMGAVIGALYAAGYTADEIRARTLAIQWGTVFDATPVLLGPLRSPRLPLLNFSLAIGDRRVARGLFGEWRINRALAQLLFDANARARGDFDRLPRRYRAIAADLKTGEKVVLADGDVARAVRASMAFPGAFAPVRWQERLLVDGGIVDNLPTIEARRLGANNIIAVNVSHPRDEDTSQVPLSNVQRSIDLMLANLHPDPKPPDVLIVPKTGDVITLSFPDDPRPLIELGLVEARRVLPAPRTPPQRVRRSYNGAPAAWSALRVQAADSALADLTRRIFAHVAPGPYDPDAVFAAMDRLYSTGLAEGVWPSVSGDSTSQNTTLNVRVDAPARLSVSVGAGFENDRGGRAWAALDRYASLARYPVVFSVSASTDGLQRFGALSGRIHGVGTPTLAWSGGPYLLENTVRTFEEDTVSTVEVVRAGGWLGLELPYILHRHLFTVTARAEWIDTEDDRRGSAFGPALRIISVPDDSRIVGTPLLVEAELRWGDWSYRRLGLTGSLTRIGRKLQVAASLDLRLTSSETPADVQPALGDQHAIPGLRWGEQRDLARLVGGMDVATPIPYGGFARLRLRSGAVAGDALLFDDSRWVSGAQLAGIWRIPFGVIEVGYGQATDGDGRFDVSIGRVF